MRLRAWLRSERLAAVQVASNFWQAFSFSDKVNAKTKSRYYRCWLIVTLNLRARKSHFEIVCVISAVVVFFLFHFAHIVGDIFSCYESPSFLSTGRFIVPFFRTPVFVVTLRCLWDCQLDWNIRENTNWPSRTVTRNCLQTNCAKMELWTQVRSLFIVYGITACIYFFYCERLTLWRIFVGVM